MIATLIPWLLLGTGALGIALGANRTLNRRENQSRLLQVLSFLGGAVLLAAPVGMVLQSGKGPPVSGVSILLMLALAICLMARALRNLPIAFILVIVTGTGMFWLFSYFKHLSFLIGDVSTQSIALVIAVLLLIVFGVSFFIEKTVDLFLGLLGVGVVIFVVAAVAFIQGLFVGLHITDHHGLLNLLSG